MHMIPNGKTILTKALAISALADTVGLLTRCSGKKNIVRLPLVLSLLISSVFVGTHPALAQEKTSAFFIVGDYASPDWEKLSFSKTKAGLVLTYAYRQREDGVRLQPVGSKSEAGQRVLQVSMPGIRQLYTIRRDRAGERLIMTSQDGRYRKLFKLGYEGPVNGVGSYCTTCANEPADAFRLVDAYFASTR